MIIISFFFNDGDVSERLKEHAWKACNGEIRSRVRISASPPFKKTKKATLAVAFLFLDVEVKFDESSFEFDDEGGMPEAGYEVARRAPELEAKATISASPPF